jgi:hypothetical protein
MKWQQIFIGIIIGLIIGFASYNYVASPEIIVKSDTITLYDSVEYSVTDSILVPYWVDSLIHDTVFTKVDSAAIIADYLTNKKYSFDSTFNEIHLQVFEEVQENKLIKREIIANNLRPTKQNIINNIYPKKQKYTAGIIAGGNSQNFDIGLHLGYTGKNNMSVIGQYHIFKKEVYVGIGYSF